MKPSCLPYEDFLVFSFKTPDFFMKILLSSIWRLSVLHMKMLWPSIWKPSGHLYEDLLVSYHLVFYMKTIWSAIWRPTDILCMKALWSSIRRPYLKPLLSSTWRPSGFLLDDFCSFTFLVFYWKHSFWSSIQDLLEDIGVFNTRRPYRLLFKKAFLSLYSMTLWFS